MFYAVSIIRMFISCYAGNGSGGRQETKGKDSYCKDRRKAEEKRGYDYPEKGRKSEHYSHDKPEKGKEVRTGQRPEKATGYKGQ